MRIPLSVIPILVLCTLEARSGFTTTLTDFNRTCRRSRPQRIPNRALLPPSMFESAHKKRREPPIRNWFHWVPVRQSRLWKSVLPPLGLHGILGLYQRPAYPASKHDCADTEFFDCGNISTTRGNTIQAWISAMRFSHNMKRSSISDRQPNSEAL
jgi:hypothetical protein